MGWIDCERTLSRYLVSLSRSQKSIYTLHMKERQRDPFQANLSHELFEEEEEKNKNIYYKLPGVQACSSSHMRGISMCSWYVSARLYVVECRQYAARTQGIYTFSLPRQDLGGKSINIDKPIYMCLWERYYHQEREGTLPRSSIYTHWRLYCGCIYRLSILSSLRVYMCVFRITV